MSESRGSYWYGVAKVVALTGLMVGLDIGVASADEFVGGTPEAGTDIPAATVKFGMRPYADNTFYVIGITKGWFKDVGILISPEPNGLKLTDQNINPLLMNGEINIASAYCPALLPTYKVTSTLKCIGFTDNFVAGAILARPGLELKSFAEFKADGMSFDDALKATMAQLDGKTLVAPPEVSARPFEEGVYALSGYRMRLQALEDPKALVLAKDGKIDFAHPGGAQTQFSLIESGWRPMITTKELIEFGPGGPDSPIQGLAQIPGVGANADYVKENPNTVLRFMSVAWRIIDAVKADPSLYELQAPFLNSFAGTDLDAAGLAQIIDSLDPLVTFDENAGYFTDPASVRYYANVYNAILADYAKNNVLPKGTATPDDFVWAKPIWEEMMTYKTKTDELLAGLEGKTLSESQRELQTKAKQFYNWRDYLDAYRYAVAASN